VDDLVFTEKAERSEEPSSLRAGTAHGNDAVAPTPAAGGTLGQLPGKELVRRDLAATSQGFVPPPAPAVLRRSLILSAAASALGAIFFTLIQGTIFNFFLEDLSLRERLPFFMGLWCIASLGMLVGSWAQGRWGCRRGLFMWGIGGSRIIWLVMGLIPIYRPEWLLERGTAFKLLAVLTVTFCFIHALGSPAWLSWMADLVPAKMQGRYWSLRQVGCSAASVLARLLSGYYLDAHKNMNGYAAIFICAAVIGIVDPLLFYGVVHRRPKLRHNRDNVFVQFAQRLKEVPLRRLCSVYVLWSVANCVIGPNCYYFARDQIGMGVASFSVVEALALVSLTAFSFLWGLYADHHGHRGPLVLCLLMQAACPIFYFPAGPHDVWLVALAWTIGTIGFCGTNLFMWPLVIKYTHSKTAGREVGIAAFNVVLGLSNFAAFMVADRVLYTSTGYWLNAPAHSTRVYLAIMALAMFLRFAAAAMACLLPKAADETEPEVVIRQIVTTNPLRAGLSFLRYITGQEVWQDMPESKTGNGEAEDGQDAIGHEAHEEHQGHEEDRKAHRVVAKRTEGAHEVCRDLP